MNDPIVWGYWEGPQLPWIKLCLKTIHRNISGVVILNPISWKGIYNNCIIRHETLDRQFVNVKSDFIRAWLLYTYGGIWIDIDAIVFRDLRPIWTKLNDCDFIAYRLGEADNLMCSALIAARRFSKICSEYLSLMIEKLQTGKTLDAMTLGPPVLLKAWNKQRFRSKMGLISSILVHQLYGAEAHVLLHNKTQRFCLNPDAYCCMLDHDIHAHLDLLTESDLLNNQTIIGRLFAKALQ